MTKVDLNIALKSPVRQAVRELYRRRMAGARKPANISTTSRRSTASRSARSPAPTRRTSRPRSTPRTPRKTPGAHRGRRTRADPQQDRRPHGSKSRSACARRDLGQRQADPRDDGRRHAARHRPFPLFRRRDPRPGRLASREIDHDTVAYHFHEPLGVVGQIIPWNFPLLMAVLEAGAGARRGQLRRAQAGRTDPGLDHGVGRADRRSAAAGRAQHRQRLRPRSRQAARLVARASPRSPSPARRRPAG